MLLGINKIIETPNHRVSLGFRMHSYVHRAQYSQPLSTDVEGNHIDLV